MSVVHIGNTPSHPLRQRSVLYIMDLNIAKSHPDGCVPMGKWNAWWKHWKRCIGFPVSQLAHLPRSYSTVVESPLTVLFNHEERRWGQNLQASWCISWRHCAGTPKWARHQANDALLSRTSWSDRQEREHDHYRQYQSVTRNISLFKWVDDLVKQSGSRLLSHEQPHADFEEVPVPDPLPVRYHVIESPVRPVAVNTQVAVPEPPADIPHSCDIAL